MSQHQQTFLAAKAPHYDQLGRRILAALTETAQQRATLTSPKIQQFYASTIVADDGQFRTALRDLQTQGYTQRAIADNIIPHVARKLGTDWEHDLITFAQVTIGCSRLQAAARRMADLDVDHLPNPCIRSQNCCVGVPLGAQHTLGAILLAGQLRQAGMRVSLDLEMTETSLGHLAQTQDIDVVMISASKSECHDQLRGLIGHVRQIWPNTKVMVGGGILDHNGDMACKAGADFATNDWQSILDHTI